MGNKVHLQIPMATAPFLHLRANLPEVLSSQQNRTVSHRGVEAVLKLTSLIC